MMSQCSHAMTVMVVAALVAACVADEIRTRAGGKVPPGMEKYTKEQARTAGALHSPSPSHSHASSVGMIDGMVERAGDNALVVAAFHFGSSAGRQRLQEGVATLGSDLTWLAAAALGDGRGARGAASFIFGSDRSVAEAAGCPADADVHTCVLMWRTAAGGGMRLGRQTWRAAPATVAGLRDAILRHAMPQASEGV